MSSKRDNAVKMAFIISILCFVLAFLSLLSAGILFFRGGGNIFKVGRPKIFFCFCFRAEYFFVPSVFV